MTNRLSLARQNLTMTTAAAPVIEATQEMTRLPSTTARPTTTTPQTTTTTVPTTTISLTPFSYDEVSLPPPTAAQAAIIKVLEEAIKIEHQRREQKRIEACQQQEQRRTRRHSPNKGSFRIEIPRCACGLFPRRGIFSMFPRGRIYSWRSHRPCRCMPEEPTSSTCATGTGQSSRPSSITRQLENVRICSAIWRNGRKLFG